VPKASFGSQAPQPFWYWQGEFGENRLFTTIEAPASGAYQNNSDPFTYMLSHPSVQEIVPRVNIQDV
jgi:hypothetical protein